MSDLLKKRNSSIFTKRMSLTVNNAENSSDNSPGLLNPKTPPPVMLRKKSSQVASPLQRKGSFGAIEDLVQCSICFEKLNIPKMLACQHTFCLNCLHAQIQNKILTCPSCKNTYPVTSANFLENLPSNLYIDNLLKLLVPPSTPTFDRTVSMFEKTGPDVQVQKRCCKCQSIMPLFSEQCCEHCKQDFCGVCWMGHISELKSQIGTLVHQLKVGSDRLNHRFNSYKDRNDWLINQITTTADKKIDEILVKKETLLIQATEILQGGEVSMKALEEQLKAMQVNVENYVSKDFEKNSNDKDKVSAFMNFHRTTVHLLNEIAHWGDIKFSFDQENFCIEQDFQVGAESEVDEPISVEVKGINNPLENADSMTLYYRSRNFLPRMIWKKCPRPAGVGIAPWSDHLYICGTDSHHVIVIDKYKGKIIERLSDPKMLYPQGIAFSQLREEIYVSDKWNHCVHVFSHTGVHLRTIGSKGSKEGHLRTPEGISIDPNENFLYVCDTGNDRVQVFKADTGTFVGYIGVYHKVEGKKTITYTQLNAPTAIATTTDRIIIADSGNRRVKIYSYDGEKQHEFGSSGSLKGQFKHPEAITVDPLGFILVGDSGNARIQIFKPSGQLIRVLGTKGDTTGKFGWISSIHITPQLDIIMSDTKFHQVVIF